MRNGTTRFCRRYRYVLKCDVVRYFPSMDREILMGALRRAIKCGRTLDLLSRIVHDAAPGDDAPTYFPGDDLFSPHDRTRGIPIGNLTSQLFGNVYLSRFDHWVQETLRAPAYLRFVDDFLIFADDRRRLADALARCRTRLAELRLELHPRKCRIGPTRCGVEFLGWHVFPDHRRLRPTWDPPSGDVKKLVRPVEELLDGEAGLSDAAASDGRTRDLLKPIWKRKQ